jgi:gas vesicle protein
MKIKDIRDLSKDDILAALGLSTKPSTAARLLGTMGTFGVGLLVGAGVALLLAPKSGEDLREDIGQRIRSFREDAADAAASAASSATSSLRGDEART